MQPHLYDRIGSLFFLIVGLFFTIYSQSVDIGNWHQPGPGFLPLMAGLSLGGMSLFLFLKSFNIKKKKDFYNFFPEKKSWKRVLLTFLGLGFYNFTLPYLGFGLTTFLFIFYLLRFIFPQTWKRSLWIALNGSIISHIIFIEFLKTQFPKGIMGF